MICQRDHRIWIVVRQKGASVGDTTVGDILGGTGTNSYLYWFCRDFLHWGTLAVAAQIIFALRFIVQWIVSERNKKSVVPPWFWYISLAGGIMLAMYAVVRDPVVLVSTAPSMVIYARNIILIHRSRSQTLQRIGILTVGSMVLLGTIHYETVGQWFANQASWFITDAADWAWFGFGFTAQLVFFMRFVWQWIASERRGESVIPVAFWHFSLAGGSMLTVYALFRDIWIVPGQAAGLIVYIRNLMLIRQANRAKHPAAAAIPRSTAARHAA